jgi:hypothetical protein
MLKFAERSPVVVGEKVTRIVQLLPPASPLPQLLLSAKSPGSVPVNVIWLMATRVVPLLVSVMVAAELVVPTG